MDIDNLWRAFEKVAAADPILFPKAIDTVQWILGTSDGKIVRKIPLAELLSLKAQVPLSDGYFSVRLYHCDVTPGIRLELFPDCYVDVEIDQFRKRATITISTVGQAMANKIAATLLEAVKLIAAEIPEHHRYLESFIAKLLNDCPAHEKNVFLIMRFRDEPPFPEIVSTLRDLCSQSGLTLLRADDREYTSDLWDNVMTYMYSCASAIAIFDQVNYREFNPNVAIETGFMLATGKPVLLLKDQAIEAMPTDIVGKTYRPFNTYDARGSLPPQVLKWLKDYRLAEVGT